MKDKNQQFPKLDELLQMEAIYFSAPIPRDMRVLTVLGTVFDKIYFPGVCMPQGKYSDQELKKEIARIESLASKRDRDTQVLLAMMKFIPHAKTLDGFCIFAGDVERPFDDKVPDEAVGQYYELVHGPNPPNWHPMFSSMHHKGLPDSEAHLSYPGDYHYPVRAMKLSSETGIRLLNDIPALPLPNSAPMFTPFDTKSLVTFLAMESVMLALPALAVLMPEELMEFREENVRYLRRFRTAMLKYTGELSKELASAKPEEFEAVAKIFVETRIAVAIEELRQSIESRRKIKPYLKDLPKVVGGLGIAAATHNYVAAGKALISAISKAFKEKASNDEIVDAHGLAYLLRLNQATN